MYLKLNEPRHDKTNKMSVRPVKTQISRPVRSVFAVRMKKAWVLSYPLSAQRRLWSDWADAQADLSLRWAHSHFVGFVMSRLKCTMINVGFFNTQGQVTIILPNFEFVQDFTPVIAAWKFQSDLFKQLTTLCPEESQIWRFSALKFVRPYYYSNYRQV